LRIVSNTSPILNLSAIGQDHLLQKLFGAIFVPLAVDQELRRLQSSTSRFAHIQIPSFVTILPVQNTPLANALKMQLHPGEAEAIALAVEQNADRLLLDEHHARVVAKRQGLQTIGCLGILLQAKQHQLVPAIRPLVEQLENQAGFWISQTLKTQLLSIAGE
jgi:uncharacterized protein